MHVQFYINIFIYLFGLLGFVLNRRNILWFLICLEMLLLSINLNFIMPPLCYIKSRKAELYNLSPNGMFGEKGIVSWQ